MRRPWMPTISKEHVELGEMGSRRQPHRTGAPKTPPLLRIHHLHRLAEVEPGAHLHLAEDDLRAATDDQVDLASADADVRAENLVSPDEVVERGAALGRPAGR